MTAIAKFWDDAVVPTLVDYIRIPAKSPHFDPEWARHGHIDAAVKLAADWCKRHAASGMSSRSCAWKGARLCSLLKYQDQKEMS